MQTITREFGYSESVCVLEPAGADCDARLRIFTHGGELPFAGHPTPGAAVVIGGRGLEDKLAPLQTGRVGRDGGYGWT